MTVNAGNVNDFVPTNFATQHLSVFETHAKGVRIKEDGLYQVIAYCSQTSFTTTQEVNLEVTQRYYDTDDTTIIAEHQNELTVGFTKDYRGVTGAPSHMATGMFVGSDSSHFVIVAKVRNQSASNIAFGDFEMVVMQISPIRPTNQGASY